MLEVIHGKPGSGKTAYCVSRLVTMLEDWARYKFENGESYPRRIYTNIPLHIDAINAYVSDKIGVDTDVSEHIEILESEFFRDEKGDYTPWWDKIPNQALIVIDEVHRYLPSSIKFEKGGQAVAKSFMVYIADHRHRQHDLLFLTQHTGNVSTEVRKMINVLYEVLNIKNMTWGYWPFTIPMGDIDVVREAFGSSAQMAHIKRGTCQANKVDYDPNCEIFLLRQSIFELYKSHTMSEQSSDRPSLRLGRAGAILWLVRRHLLRLGGWSIVTVVGVMIAWNVFWSIPDVFKRMLNPKTKTSPSVVTKTETVTLPDGETKIPLPAVAGDDKITGFVRGGVITPRGVIRKDEHITIDGEKDFVQSVDVVRGVVYLGSGRKVQK